MNRFFSPNVFLGTFQLWELVRTHGELTKKTWLDLKPSETAAPVIELGQLDNHFLGFEGDHKLDDNIHIIYPP